MLLYKTRVYNFIANYSSPHIYVAFYLEHIYSVHKTI